MEWKKVDAIAHQAPVVLIALTLVAVFSFAGVGRLVAGFNHHEKNLAAALFQRGKAERQNGQTADAIRDFQSALQYDPGNYQYQLNLALALTDAKRYDQALVYLLSLFDRQPQDGYVNLALARLYAQRGDFDDAVRHYHNAIYGLWGEEAGAHRREARLELVNLLLSRHERMQAQAELVASSTSLPPDPAVHLEIADYFMRAQDYTDAVREYRNVLTLDHKNQAALAGAGEAAFQVGQYDTARAYLRRAIESGLQDTHAAQLLKTTEDILDSDPFVRKISEGERRQRIGNAFLQAEERLQSCARQKGQELDPPPPSVRSTPLQLLQEDWLQLKSDFRGGSFHGDISTADDAIDLVFRIEQETQAECGAPQGKDLALLLIARSRENEH